MKEKDFADYEAVRRGGIGFYAEKPGLIEVSGSEAVAFLNGLITNDAAKLENGKWMRAAFPNAQGRLLAAARVLRIDDKFVFETEAETYEKVLKNLERFTLAGDFKVRDLTAEFLRISVRGREISNFTFQIPNEYEIVEARFGGETGFLIRAFRAEGFDALVPNSSKKVFVEELKNTGAIEIGEETKEILRIENGVPKYGVEMDETTIVPELGINDLISYNKGCYIGQEIIARIHFRGHIAKQLTGLILSESLNEDSIAELRNVELKTHEGKNAGKITSATFSPELNKIVALAFVRYDYLSEGTELKANETTAAVKILPFVS